MVGSIDPFHIHPRQVAVVVVVREKRVGAFRQERLERRLARERRSLAKERRRLGQLVLVLDVVGNEREALSHPSNHGEESVGARAFGYGQRFDPTLDVGLGRSVRVKIRRLWFRRRAGHEDLVVIEARPWALINKEIVQPRAPFGRLVANQIEQHALVPRPHLPHEQRVHDLRRLHEPGEHLPIGRRQPRDIGRNLGRCEAFGHLVQPGRLVRRCGSCFPGLSRGLGHRSLLGGRARGDTHTHRHYRGDNRSFSIHDDSLQLGGWGLGVGARGWGLGAGD